MNLIKQTYKELTPVEIMEYLCFDSANGFREEAVAQQEADLGISFPGVLRNYLLRAGMECISARKPVFLLSSFRNQEGYLVLGSEERGLIGILTEDSVKEDPAVYVQVSPGNWRLLAESLTAYLMMELDQRLREARKFDYVEYHTERPERYYCCTHLESWELTGYMDSSAVYHAGGRQEYPPRGEEWGEEKEWEDFILVGSVEYEYHNDGMICPQELRETLGRNSIPVSEQMYKLGICFDGETDTLYSAHLMPDGRFESLLQVNSGLTVRLCRAVSAQKLHCAEELLTILAKEVHDPVMAYCRTRLDTLPEKVSSLAEAELHIWTADVIGDFLKLFDKKDPWKLGVLDSNIFVECSRLSRQESLTDLWSVRHLKADPQPWNPSLTRASGGGEPAPAQLEPLVKELIYRVHDYNLLNRYSFLARKMVTNGNFSKLTEDYTEEERFALLFFYREILDGVMERLFACLEKRLFIIQVGGQEFLKLCPEPVDKLGGWLRWYGRKNLDFLDDGKWQQ